MPGASAPAAILCPRVLPSGNHDGHMLAACDPETVPRIGCKSEQIMNMCRFLMGGMVGRREVRPEERCGLRRCSRIGGLPRQPDRCHAAGRQHALRSENPMSPSTPCTVRWARTANDPGCAGIPAHSYTHSGVLASALAMDKAPGQDGDAGCGRASSAGESR